MHLEDVGHDIGWPEFKAWFEHLPPTAESAYHRHLYPHDWWYDKAFEVAALQLQAVQGANWQRAGSKGKKPGLYRPAYPQPVRPAANVIPLDQIKNRLAAAQKSARAQ